MKTLVGILGFALCAGACSAEEIAGTFGPPLPDGWSDRGGSCIGGSVGIGKVCDYSIGVAERANRLVLYFGKSVRSLDPTKARWYVTDQMPYPKAPSGFHVVYGLCERNGIPDQSIIAVVKATEAEWHTVVRRAYKANFSTGRFEKTSVKGLRCSNEGWGI